MTAQSTQAIRAPLCPVCGAENDCVASAFGDFSQACWCQTLTFSPDLLARVPSDLRNQACICRRCAEAEFCD